MKGSIWNVIGSAKEASDVFIGYPLPPSFFGVGGRGRDSYSTI